MGFASSALAQVPYSTTTQVGNESRIAVSPIQLLARSVAMQGSEASSLSTSSITASSAVTSFETPTKTPICTLVSGYTYAHCPVEPSIFSGRPAQYVVDPGSSTSGRYIRGIGLLSCMVTDSNGGIYGRPGSFTFEWQLIAGSGGHATPHVQTQPSLKFIYAGETVQELGTNQSPGSITSGTVTIQVSAADSLSSYNTWIAGGLGSPSITVFLPESAQSATIQFLEWHCARSPEEIGNTLFTFGGIGFQMGMLVDLVRVENITSLNGNATLTIERVTNSHGDDAGYATADTQERLVQLVENYSACSTHTENGSYPIKTEAISLPFGGHYDINRNFRASHNNHRAGEDVDIGFSSLSQAERNCLYLAYQDLFATPVNIESLALDSNGNAVPVNKTHVHLWSGATHKYPRDQTQTLATAGYNYLCDQFGC